MKLTHRARILANGTILPPFYESTTPPIPRAAPQRERIVQQAKQTTPPPRGK